jgi:hypothetical protein
MNTNTNMKWTQRRMASLALAVAGVTVVGLLAAGSASAQGGGTVNPLRSPLCTPRAEEGQSGESGNLAAVAQALGIDEAVLKAALKSGKTIADVAQANNVPVANVIAAIVADRQSHIAQAVADGKLTQAQADEKLEYLTAKVTESVSTLPLQGGNGGNGGGGRGRENAPAAPSASGVTGQPSNTGRSQAPAEQPTASAANSTTAAATAVPPSGNVGGGRGGNGGGRGGNTGGNGGGRGGNGRP